MKTFQKITLAAAISAAPFMAQAELTPMDDALMGDTTGQAGVTIEIDIAAGGISVGEIEYQDEGSVLLQNARISNVNGLTQEIDVDARGDVVIGMGAVDGVTIDLGDSGNGLDSAVALQNAAGTATTELVNDVHMVVNLGASTTRIMNLQDRDAAELAALPAGMSSVANSAAGLGSVAIQMQQSLEITDLDVGAFGYTQAQAATRGTAAANNAATTYNAGYTGLTDVGGAAGVADEQAAYIAANAAAAGDADASGDVDATEEGAVATATTAALATGSAVKLNNVRFYGTGGVGTAATINQTVWAKGGTAAQGGGVYINIQGIQGTLEVGGIELGGESIGTVRVSDINLAGLTQRIYGHN
jgi:hypothetical protein